MKIRVVVVSIGVVFLMLFMIAIRSNRGSFLLINKAQEPILLVSVTVCRQTIELKNIYPTKSVSSIYKVKADSHYDIKIEFLSGKKISKQLGYVTSGIDFHHELVVTDTDVYMAGWKVGDRPLKCDYNQVCESSEALVRTLWGASQKK